MFWLIEQISIALLNFIGSLATKCVSLINETCMVRPTGIDLGAIELSYYPFMIVLDKCNGSCNASDGLSTCLLGVPNELKDINVKLFNMITRLNEALLKHFSCDCKCTFNSTTCNSNQKWNNETC